MIPGYAILPEFDPFPDAGTVRGISKTSFYSTMAEIELQFSIPRATDAGSLLGLTKDFLLITEWANNSLWINMDCFKGATPNCKMSSKLIFYWLRKESHVHEVEGSNPHC